MTLTAGQASVVRAILAATDTEHLRLALLVGSYLESNWTPTDKQTPTGETGVGAFQITRTAHPTVTVAEADNPTWATDYMLGTYESALSRVGGSTWSSTPERAAETVAYDAERPAETYYDSQGSARVADAYNSAVAVVTTPQYQPTTHKPLEETTMICIRNKTSGAVYFCTGGKLVALTNSTIYAALEAVTVKTVELSSTNFSDFVANF